MSFALELGQEPPGPDRGGLSQAAECWWATVRDECFGAKVLAAAWAFYSVFTPLVLLTLLLSLVAVHKHLLP